MLNIQLLELVIITPLQVQVRGIYHHLHLRDKFSKVMLKLEKLQRKDNSKRHYRTHKEQTKIQIKVELQSP